MLRTIVPAAMLALLGLVFARQAMAACPPPQPTTIIGLGASPRFQEVQFKHGGGPTNSATVTVPYFFGVSSEKAQSLANDACVTLKFTGPIDGAAKVVTQSIPPGKSVTPHALVRLTMAVVPETSVPPLLGLNREAAAARAEASGLQPLFYGPQTSGALVAAQSRPPGQTVAKGSYIQLQMGAAKPVLVPDFTGKTRSEAEGLAVSSRLRASFSGPESSTARVARQNPAPGSQALPGAVEQLQLAAEPILTPNIMGRTRASAQATVARRGLVLDLAGDPSDTARVSHQSPSPGATVEPGSHVQATMAVGPLPPPPPPNTGVVLAVVPSVVGDSLPLAEATLKRYGFFPIATGESQAEATVRSQVPAGNAKAPVQSTVRIVLSTNETTVVPDLVTQSRNDARKTLGARRLVPEYRGASDDDAVVKSQSPAAGRTVHQGEHVILEMEQPPFWPLVVLLGVLAALAAGGLFLARRIWPWLKKIIDRWRHRLPMVVTYAAHSDSGRPTVRLSKEPQKAARALILGPPAEHRG